MLKIVNFILKHKKEFEGVILIYMAHVTDQLAGSCLKSKEISGSMKEK
jgi:hypothetical protein